MANTPKPKSSLVTDVLAFVTDKKKLPLLLLLLGGSATVVTTAAVVLSGPRGGNESSGPISGNEVPNWDFDDATLTADGNGIGASFDFRYMARFQNDYYIQAGRNFFEGATLQSEEHTESAFSVYNFRTGEIIFEYTFEIGDAHRNAILGGSNFSYWSDIRVAFDNESTIFVSLDSNFPSTLGGSYGPMKTHAISKFGDLNSSDYVQFFLAFDLDDATTYTVLDSRISNQSDFYFNDMLYDNGQLYLSTHYSKNFLENSVNRNEDNLFDFLTVPTDIPNLTFANNSQEQRIGYIVQVSVEGSTLEFLTATPFAANFNSNIWFQGYRQGFETRYFTEEGHMVLTTNFWNNSYNNSSTISSFFDTLETTFLQEDSTALEEAEAESLAAYETVLDTPNGEGLDSFNFNLNFTGFFNFETEKFEHAITGYNVYGYDYNSGVENRAEAYNWPSLFLTDSGDSFVIDNKVLIVWEGQVSQQTYSQYNPERLVDSVSTLSRYNLETGEKTLVIEHDNNGTILSGIYEKSNGYYLTGSYYETDTNDIASVDAFLLATNDTFVTQQELILSGSNDDMGLNIMLNASGRPVWIVQSNSTDGDFAGLGGVENRFSTYSVSF
jgi:hypothetical protein